MVQSPSRKRVRSRSSRSPMQPRRRRGRTAQPRSGSLQSSPRWRVFLLIFILTNAFAVLSVQLVWVGTVPATPRSSSLNHLPTAPLHRGDVYDRNGVLMATSITGWSLFADPKMVLDARQAAVDLHQVFPEISREKFYKRLSRKGRFIWLKRNLSPQEAHKVNRLGIPGLGFRQEVTRVYPQKNLAPHILGNVNVDGRGMAGVEATQNNKLMEGQDVQLTLDVRLQQQMRDVLARTIEKASAHSAAGVALDPRTGEVLAMVSLPDYDANTYGAAAAQTRMNNASYSLYEMGSVFKLFTAANALESGLFHLDSKIDCRKPIRVARFTIDDFHPDRRKMTLREVIAKSSNIGTAQMAKELGPEKMKPFFGRLGLYDKLQTGLLESSTPLTPRRWGPTETLTVSYGHGIAVTPLHVASGVGALIAPEGLKSPTLIKKKGVEVSEPMFSENVLADMRTLMRTVVEEGTGRRARLEGYDIGGKTGTAEKLGAKGYDEKRNVASFVGALPLENPQLVVAIIVDGGDWHHRTGGQVSAPAFKEFVARAAPLLGMYPDPALMPKKEKAVAKKPAVRQVKPVKNGTRVAVVKE